MHWNYRLMRSIHGDEISYAVHEVFYDEDGTVRTWTEQPIEVVADSRAGVLLTLAQMADAVSKPVLDAASGLEAEGAESRLARRAGEIVRLLSEAERPASGGE